MKTKLLHRGTRGWRAFAAPTLWTLALAALAGCGSGQGTPAGDAAAPRPGAAAAARSADTSAGAAATAAAAPPADTGALRPQVWPERRVLEENALATATYRPGDPAACGRPGVAGDGQRRIVVFFGCTPASGPVVNAVPARVVSVPAGSDPVTAAVGALLAGPTAAERQAGLLSAFGQETANVPFVARRLEHGLAVVDLHPSVRRGGTFVSNMEAAQLVATLSQFSGVQRVAVLVGGQPLCRALGQC